MPTILLFIDIKQLIEQFILQRAKNYRRLNSQISFPRLVLYIIDS